MLLTFLSLERTPSGLLNWESPLALLEKTVAWLLAMSCNMFFGTVSLCGTSMEECEGLKLGQSGAVVVS